MRTKNILIYAKAKKTKGIEALGYKLPIGFGGVEKNIIVNLNLLKTHFNTYLLLINSNDCSNCFADGINVIPSGFSFQSRLFLYLAFLSKLLRNNLFTAYGLEKDKTVVIIHDDVILSFLTKVLHPKLTVFYSIESKYSTLMWRRGGNLILKITDLILFFLNALIVNKIINGKTDPWRFEKYFGFIKNKSYYLPNGINKEIFKPYCGNKSSLIKINEITDKDILLLYVGRITDIKYKNPELLFKSFEALTKKKDNVKLIIIGADKEDGNRLLKKYRVKNKESIFFEGIISNESVIPYYQRCDLTLLTSKSESSPYAILESLACGTPCVSTNVIDKWAIKDGINGYISNNYKVEDFTAAIFKGLELSLKLKAENKSLLNPVYDIKNRERILLGFIQ